MRAHILTGGLWLGVACIFPGLIGCSAGKDKTGYEYAPQMYHSVPYEGLSQIKDREAGRWLTTRKEGAAEFYNSNPHNPHGMTMRLPVPGTVKRGDKRFLPYRIPKDSLDYASRTLRNPLSDHEAVVAEGKALYARFCQHCHGSEGQGDGPVGQVYKGIPKYNAKAQRTLSEGHIFHVITHGKGRMYPHGTQLSQEERWKIVRYVQVLQRQ